MGIKILYIISYAMLNFSIGWFVFAMQMTFFKKQMKRIPAAIIVTALSCVFSGLSSLFAVGSLGKGANVFAYLEDLPLIAFFIGSFIFFKKKKVLCAFENLFLFVCTETCLALNLVFISEYVLKDIFLYQEDILKNPTQYDVYANIVASFLVTALALYMYLRLYRTGKYREVKRTHGFFLIGMFCFNELIIFFTYIYNHSLRWYTIWLFILLAMVSLVLPILIISVQIRRKTEFKNILQDEMIKSEMAYIENYKEKQEETKRMRHDMKNNLSLLSMLLEQEKYDEARTYLAQMNESVWMASPKFVSGDSYLDCILTMKSEAVESAGIKFNLSGVIEGGLKWPPMDVVAVFGNAIDNAIEECKKIPAEKQPYINFTIRKTEQFVIVRVENPVATTVDTSMFEEEGALPTSKADKELHGIGLSNISRVAKSHDGIVKCECDGERFVLSIMAH